MMANTNLIWQNKDSLFPDILWSRPENSKLAGKLLIIGGNKNSFQMTSQAYICTNQAGAGEVKVVLPDSLKPTLQDAFPGQIFVLSTKTGEIAHSAFQGIMNLTNNVDGILLSGDLGKNSQTSALLLELLEHTQIQVTLSENALNLMLTETEYLAKRNHTCLVMSFSKLQQFFKKIGNSKPIISTMPVQTLGEVLCGFTSANPIIIITMHNGQVLVSYSGKASATKLSAQSDDWQVKTASFASVFWLQNPTKPFEAITTAVFL